MSRARSAMQEKKILNVSSEILLKQMKKSLAPHSLIMVPKGSDLLS